MKTKYLVALFIIVAIVQLTVPAQMIWQRESILKTGKAFKFKTQPVDPSDPFKGKYIYLNYELNSFISNEETWKRGQDIFVSITKDSLGFAKATAIAKQAPQHQTYVKAKVDWSVKKNERVNFTLPFNEFYMEESKAYNAEVAHRNAQQDSLPNNTYALVYVKEGEAVLDNVFINETPIAVFVEQ
ncbi:GDYXXLXY domain-containing protein [Psychroserpens sp. S379A]|uniref:GDYXXLXY domain-containing protein n=1 Tax=Psychroserpens sp. S379A TaxID=3415137 RepID=UPI003C7B51EB